MKGWKEEKKFPKQLPSGARGGKGREKTHGAGLQVTPFYATHLPSRDPVLLSPLRREQAPITSYYGSGQWNDVPGN